MKFSDMRPIEPLAGEHERKAFCSGVRNLDNYLRDRALSDTQRNLSRVFVLTLLSEPNTIVGYYALSSLMIPVEVLPESLSKKLNYKAIGATLLGKLAIAEDWQRGKCDLRLGEYLLLHAMLSTWRAAQSVASWALLVDVLTGEKGDPTAFYIEKGFIPFRDNANRLFLPMPTIEEALQKAGLI